MKRSSIVLSDPAIMLFPSDFLSEGAFMTLTELGMFIKIICLSHIHGHLSREQISSICDSSTDKIIKSLERDDDGRYYHKRTEYEALKRRKFRESRVSNLNGVKGHATKRVSIERPTGDEASDEVKRAYGKLNNVLLTDKEYSELKSKFGNGLDSKITSLSLHIGSEGDKYKSHYATILKWDNTEKVKNAPVERDYSDYEAIAAKYH